MAQFPSHADVVIIGLGGIVGASLAHHLIERGWTNIVGIDKSAVPTDIGSTAHASDFCYMTSHDQLTCYTTMYSADFYERLGHYHRIGGIEVARVGDDERMNELKRRVDSGKAYGTRARMISPAEAKEKMPLIEEEMIQGAMWDPDAGLVTPRSQTVVGELINTAEQSGKLSVFANTPATDLEIRDGRIVGVHTHRGYIEAPYVVVCAGLWGRLIAEMAGEDLPVMPVDHPLLWFGPYDEFAGSGKEIGYPLLRDQGNSAYLRDTGDPATTEGGQIEWGYYEEKAPRLVHPSDILEKEQARLSPSQRDLEMEQIIEPLERAIELTPILAELGYDEKRSFNGLLQVTSDGGPSIGESVEVRGLWYAVAVWVKDGPGIGKVLADWMTDGVTEFDHHGIDVARFYPAQKTRHYIQERCFESAFKIYNPPVHPREPYTAARGLRRSPFWPREKELGGHFMELAGWERAHGYACNEHLLEKYADRVPVRANEWDNRHFWRVSNAEHLALSESVGMINLSHFAVYDVTGPGAEPLLEYLSVAKVGGDTPIGKGVYTHFLDGHGGVRADLTVLRLGPSHYRVIDGADAGNRDMAWMKRIADERGHDDVHIQDLSDHWACLGVWGPQARATLQRIADRPEQWDLDAFPFAHVRTLTLQGIPVTAFRISYVGEQGWELHVPFSHGLALWDALFDLGVTPVGIETYANSRRLEKSLRLQNADLLTHYNLYEAGLARPKVKAAEFHGKAAYLEQREKDQQPAYLCTLTMLDNHDGEGVARYPVGNCPIIDPATGEVLIDALGRRSYTTSIAFGPSIGKNIALGYLPAAVAEVGKELLIEYFNEPYPVRVEAVGYGALYDPESALPRS
ncbi:GcvT family protein [Halomonas urumqiensis]|uniref:Dehydrogenase n=1 Tax=Halomonas urumqiensis TaxID=1684789 RepID=A0A2N7UC71_9GAMM|nr:FAD-dependent oxidoreductase [Halomonas urumqiensis]PMR78042.1 dehydrogenase [Halomonas urumqiensis]PTB03193.1 FAD-dependent oxidoreductase [Halomonas urumqiensis]GHE20659.1 dehydrogenase [Halomonas urumqiensis]